MKHHPVPFHGWSAVFGGTVVEVKQVKEKYSGNIIKEFVRGKFVVEKIFRNFADSSEITIGSKIETDNFDGLKQGDKVIIFIDDLYEGGYVMTDIAETNTKLGFKVNDWNEPIVSLLEKIAPCDKTVISWIKGHPKDFRAKVYACGNETDAMILDNTENAEIWKRYDPKGFQELLEGRKMLKEN